MTNERNVLIISTIADVATDDVVRRLTAKQIPHVRINTEDYPFSRTFTIFPTKGSEAGWLLSDGRRIPSPTAIWYRRVRTPPRPTEMDNGIYEFCMQETRTALLGSIMNISARWMSHPAAVWQTEFKPYQLSLASVVGLLVPRTIITNDPAAIRTAFNEFGHMIVKPVRTGHVVHGDQEFAVFTSQVLEEHLVELESARLSPSIYQELIPKQFDIRATIVGRKIFAAAIDSQSDPSSTIDWRCTTNPNLPHTRIELPEHVADQLLRLMDIAHLQFAAVDLIQTPGGEYVFLEVNPSGQWLWIDDMLDYGISDCISEWLSQPGVR
jgi:glutathione synthase/RimK-type ligase-like ATP-grasp enzyme